MAKAHLAKKSTCTGKFVGLHIPMTIHPNKYNSISIMGSKSKSTVHTPMMLHTNYCSICFAGSREFFFKIYLNSLRPLNNPSPQRINFVSTNLNLLFSRTIPAKCWQQLTWPFALGELINKNIYGINNNNFFLLNKCGHRNVLSKRQVWMSIFHIINFRKKQFMDTRVLDFFLIKN